MTTVTRVQRQDLPRTFVGDGATPESFAEVFSTQAGDSKTVTTATITSGQTASAAVNLGFTSICGLICPAAMTGTTLSIQASSTSGGTYITLKDITATAVTFTFAANQAYYVDPIITAGFQYIKITSSGAEGADRVITLLTRPV